MGKTRQATQREQTNYALMASIFQESEPNTYEQAHGNLDWDKAMKSEYSSLMQNGTWELCQRPKEKKVIGTRWIYKIKHHANGTLKQYK
eukprot:c54933_g1_i1 orf=134-400(+)